MVIDDVAAPLVAAHGPEVGYEIVAGAELTRLAFKEAGDQMLAVSRAFDAAIDQGRASPRRPDPASTSAPATPSSAGTLPPKTPIQVGGLGLVDAGLFADFPAGSIGRLALEAAA
jgi:hypothetical protein